MTLLGLFFIALGSGGIKPCVAAFGGDQFKLPEQAKQVATFFSLFYFSINAGSLISSSITPILRQDVNCFGDDTCYSLAFGVPGILMCISIVIFIAGKFLYKVVPPAGNVVVLVTKCIGVRLSLCISWYLRSIYNRRTLSQPVGGNPKSTRKTTGWTILNKNTAGNWFSTQRFFSTFWFYTFRFHFSGRSSTKRVLAGRSRQLEWMVTLAFTPLNPTRCRSLTHCSS